MAENQAAKLTWAFFAGCRCAFIALAAHFVMIDAVAATPSINAGGSHSIALHADGTVRAWGNDGSGQLGVGRSLASGTPITVAGATDITAIAAGDSHVLALKSDGTVLSWGNNTNGQLGDSTTINRSTPVRVVGLTGVVAIWARGSHSLALSGGSVWVWGANGLGQLGDGSYQDRSSPVRLSALNDVLALSAGGGFTLALRRDGSVWAWGANSSGQLGDGTRTAPFTGRTTPALVIGLAGIADIRAGGEHSLARKADGSVWAWGNNNLGQLGDGTTAERLTPVQVNGLTGALQIAAGFGHSLALKGDGTVMAWGGNGYGELGDGTFIDRLLPIPLGGLSGTTSIATGFLHTFALIAGGTVVAWGNNDYGQLGDGSTRQRLTPAPVNGISNVRAVAVGDQHSVALRSDGTVLTWGDNASGQLGNGARIFRSTPIALALTGVSKISAGGFHAVALKADGSVLSWGDNRGGQLGNGTTLNRAVPAAVNGLSSASGITAVSAGGLHALALNAEGNVLAWGDNFSSQLGDRSNPDTTFPAPVIGLSGMVAIAAGAEHSVALKNDRSVWTWGRNNAGQLGDGTMTIGYAGRATPARVNGLSNVIAIAAGSAHTVALKSDGTVAAWGSNGGGRLGDGTTTDRLTPVQVSGLSGVTAVSAGDTHTLALKSDGSVWAWGSNYAFQLGDGTTTDRVLPVQVAGLSGIVAISATSHSFALKSDGTVLSWGRSDFGQIGDGTLADRLTPVIVLRENGAGSVATNDWFLDLSPAVTKTIPPDRVPVFLAVATSAPNDIITSIQYRAADVGTNPNVYVFALAPASMVRNVSAEAIANHKGPVTRGIGTADAPLPCVLAQLTASGQLTAVTASSLQAYLTGVLSSQGASVSVLNGVSTALLSGAVFYVGYGSNATSMINGGTNRSIVTVPGTQTCQPQAPQTGWWWNPAEDGRGFGIEVRGNTMFMSGYLYDQSGNATWVVSAGPAALDGSFFNNTLYHVSNGQTLTGPYKAPAPVTLDGPITLSFTDARNGTLIWLGGSFPIVRFDTIIGSGNGVTPAFVPENGWWWNEAESGRGFFMEFKNNFAFIAGYMYVASGPPVWYVAQGLMTTPQSFSNNWYQAGNGQTMTGPYKKPTIINSNVGPVTIVFTDTSNALLTLPGGRQVAITRHRF